MDLPEWAEPSTRSPLAPAKGNPITNQPDLPDDPSPVPVDGGLSLLALAGAGYAARKLRQDKDEDETDRDDVV